MRAYDVIMKKRNGLENTKEEVEFMINNYVSGELKDYQMAAWLMAVYFNHMTDEERYNLTIAMLNSGDRVSLKDIKGKKIDKHSTGGVGDKTTIALAPMVASLGLSVSKLSGRGLGHTGGTIDKLESIPGYKTALSTEEFIDIANKTGIAIAGQTANIAPADKKIYALRDLTATVDEISLIASSIMSKKLAIDSDGIILDVKAGTGAFMKDIQDAKTLAESMVSIGKMNGKNMKALVTNMNQPLGMKVGNALEVYEAIETVKGKGPNDFQELCVELACYMAELSEEMSYEEAKEKLNKNIENGTVAKKMKEWISAQGGNSEVVDDPNLLTISKNKKEIYAENDGYIFNFDTEKIGIASMMLGAGRATKEDVIDLSVGLEVHVKLGDKIKKGDKIVTLYYSDNSDLKESEKTIKNAIKISDKKPDEFIVKTIYEIID
ncbi:thymidine phosphorylase [Geotoga petraea]|jgi:pyrimidine-nucleoside phosphorylase|uniref:Thymidine phosphorylase n=1 Tax=Geotoga petraea TaxID=28234 RepID=A0A1G6JJD2_9BACT|nr:thymidine phosphorylase [Geotoga petraea]MDK2945380.1 pyrimidine-nucleoside phosphorylase [Geotoga sp.]TGG88237.1 thymidine phosphorylase [Geotoga petraea]SDC18834.1 thymidine phosphorylase [Geotoga petraea]